MANQTELGANETILPPEPWQASLTGPAWCHIAASKSITPGIHKLITHKSSFSNPKASSKQAMEGVKG